MPTGKQNTFANRTVPDLAYITLRRDQPVNLAGAFERPVPANGDGYVMNSTQALARYAQQVYQSFVAPPEHAFCVGIPEAAEFLAPTAGIQQILETIEHVVQDYCKVEETQ